MAQYTYPGVYVEEIPSGVRSISGVATSIALFIGWTRRGAVDSAVRITSFADYEREFGGLDVDTYLPYAVKAFYDNGGVDAYVLRLVAEDAAGAAGPEAAEDDPPSIAFAASSPGAWGNDYSVRITPRDDPDADRFRVDVLFVPNGNEVVESFENLSVDSRDARYAATMINGRSRLITVTIGEDAEVPEDPETIPLAGGEDGALLSPTDDPFLTALDGLFGVGTITDRIDIFNLVCVPGLAADDAIKTLQGHCRRRRAFLLVDSVQDNTIDQMASSVATFAGADGMNAALFFPWVLARDPQLEGAVRDYPPCGFVAGIFARTDAQRGVWKAPAGIDAGINGASGLVIAMSDTENGQLNPRGVNCLRTLPVYGTVLWGSRTLHGDNGRASEWKYVPVRRLALFIEESLYRGTQWVVFEPNDEPLWAQIRLNVGAFLQDLFRQGAFQGQRPRDAYFVRCDRTTTTQSDINLGIVNILVGFAPLKPAEFVVLKIQQMAGEIPT